MNGNAMTIRNDTQACVIGYLRAEFSPIPGGAKLLGRLARCSHRTAERWLQERSTPAAAHLTEMLRHPRFRERFLAAIDAERRGE